MRILSRPGLWMLCVCSLGITSLPHTIATASAEPKTKKKKAPSKAKRVVKPAAKTKNVRKCVRFSQQIGADEESVDLTLKSNCKFEVICSLEWELTCSGDDGEASSAPGKRSASMLFAEDFKVNASASMCEESWEVGDVKWNCVPAAP